MINLHEVSERTRWVPRVWVCVLALVLLGPALAPGYVLSYDLDKVVAKVREREAHGHLYTIVVVAEGAKAKDGVLGLVAPAEVGHAERLGGIGESVANRLGTVTGKDTRVVVLGHLLRGGSPTAKRRDGGAGHQRRGLCRPGRSGRAYA